jgi:hypothetical protein
VIPWKRSRRLEVESELRAARAEPPQALIERIETTIERSAPTSHLRARLAVGATLTAVMVAAVAAVGGVSAAASGVGHAVRSLTGLTGTHAPRVVDRTSAGHQYGHLIKICHHGRVIAISASALPAHLALGDFTVPLSSVVGSICHH